ncbi:MAG: GAF domain-containing protein [Acidobacteria bacterium]|nr:GAF domain-containing protein [Acidobacteriota bacterium]
MAFDLLSFLRSSWQIWLSLAIVGAAAAIMRQRSANHRQRQRSQLEAAHAAAAQSLGAADRESALQPIAAALPGLLAATNAQILLVDSGEQQMAYVAGAKGRPRGALSMSTISGPVTCFRAKETTEVADAENCPFVSKEWVAKRRLKSALYVPILSGGACIGVIEIEDRARKRGFDEGQLAVAEHLARIAELSLRLYDQRSMTEQLHRSEKLASVSELANAMAAELSEPFAEAQRLLSSGNVRGVREATEQVSRAEEALQRLVRFANPNSAEVTTVDLNALVRKVSGEHRKADDGRGAVKLSLNERTPQVTADPAHLEQVFQILFRHARHFVKRLEGRTLQVHTAIRETMVVVSIAPLASAEHPMRKSLAQIPDAGMNATLGFTICQALVERADGSLQMDPASSLGFRIDLEYPLARTATQETVEEGVTLHRTPGGIRSGPVTALVVEPNESIRKLIVQQLAEQSVRAIPVTNIEEAKSICGRMQFDWVFCELSLPQGSGIELYEAVRNGIERFVFIADDAACAANSEAFQASDKAVLRKPVREEAVEALIDELQGGAVLQRG